MSNPLLDKITLNWVHVVYAKITSEMNDIPSCKQSQQWLQGVCVWFHFFDMSYHLYSQNWFIWPGSTCDGWYPIMLPMYIYKM